MQNTSHAVMAQRYEAKESLDNFPTPPWATRALLEHGIPKIHNYSEQTCLEPACGQGYMAEPLAEYFGDVTATDIENYGYGKTVDFLNTSYSENSYDWVITNPPFKLAESFIQHAMPIARKGVAMLTRTVFLESIGRYERIFSVKPPTIFSQFCERVPMVKGRLDRKASTATGYAWLIWEKGISSDPKLQWLPPCRKALEKDDDYLELNAKNSQEVLETFEAQRQVELFEAEAV